MNGVMKQGADKEIELLYRAIVSVNSVDECKEFFDDVCTIKEITSIAQRLTVAKLLKEGKTFNEIVEETGASSATISRVNKCLMYGNGYKQILDKLK